MRVFPFRHAEKREPVFYPEAPADFAADVLEIGPGRGEFLLSLAAANPRYRFVGIELKRRRFRRIGARIERQGLANVLLIYGDGRILLPRIFAPETFQTIYVLFPDPWPKRRHEPMRLLSAEFLQVAGERLRVGGELVVATDDLAYKAWVTKQAAKVELLQPTELEPSGAAPRPDWVPTHYEQRWREEGRTISYFGFRRTAASPNAERNSAHE